MIQTLIRAGLLALLFLCAAPSAGMAGIFHHGRVVYIGGVPYVVRGHHHGRWAYPFMYGYSPSTVIKGGGGGGSSGGGGGDEPSGNEAAKPGVGSDGDSAGPDDASQTKSDPEIADLRKRIQAMEKRLDEGGRTAPAILDQTVDALGLKVQRLYDEAVELGARRDITLVEVNAYRTRVPPERTDLLKRLDAYTKELEDLTIPAK